LGRIAGINRALTNSTNKAVQVEGKLEKGSCETTCLFTLDQQMEGKIQTIRLLSNFGETDIFTVLHFLLLISLA
jgi:hypothetical protein